MDWFRRNWPDLLIGIALVAVIAGIIATLITGGSFFSIGQPTTTNTPVTTPQTAPPTNAETNPAGDVPVVPGAPTDPAGGTPVVTPPQDTTQPAPQGDTGPTVAVLPPTDNAAPAANPPATPDTTPTPVVEAPAVTPAETPAATPAAPAATPPAAPVTVPAADADLPAPSANPDAPYRVSVGAFGTLENAERQAQGFRAAGYPVLIGTQGTLSLVLIGPYEQRADAERVATRIAAAGLVEDALIYTFEPDEETGAAAPAEPPAATPAQTPAVTPAATEGRFLQVGAYATEESAAPQRERLTALGFSVSSRVESDLIKLLIGPFSGQQLSDAQATLEAAGIQNFVR